MGCGPHFLGTLEAHLGGRPQGAAGSTLFFGQNKPEGPQKLFLNLGPFLLNRIWTSGSSTYLESMCVAEGALHLACERDVSSCRFSSGGATTEMGPTVIDINCCGVRRKVTRIFNLVSVIPPVTSRDAISLFKSFSYLWISTLWWWSGDVSIVYDDASTQEQIFL